MPEKIGFVGVGRMGANMARRLKDQGFTISAVYDARGKVAKEIAAELGAEPCKNVAKVTELSDLVITVVSDDKAMYDIFPKANKGLLKNAQGKLFINCATIAADSRRCRKSSRKLPARKASKPAWPRASRRPAKARCT
jgi:3-hydroxyisobutyrate dehydrogenase